MNRIYS